MVDDSVIEVSVCLCTYKRPEKVAQCLESLQSQTFNQRFEVIVTDNDFERSGEKAVNKIKTGFQTARIPLFYLVEPVQNISLARNRSVRAARGTYVAFIDDDEYAPPHWLETLHQVLLETDADGVWGPVIPDIPEIFPESTPAGRPYEDG